MSSSIDVLVVGGGPAGAAAAITAAEAGCSVRVIERVLFPRHRPGESLHPGVEPLLTVLGVADEVAASSPVRPEAQAVVWGGRATVTPFGRDDHGPWRGYQIDRADLDGILLRRAVELGADLRQPATPGAVALVGGRVAGSKENPARFVVDATGSGGWLRRQLSLPVVVASPPLRAWYGYCCGGSGDPIPLIEGDADGWTWNALVGPDRVQWTRLAFPGAPARAGAPARLAMLDADGPARACDVTWRRALHSAGPGWFLAGDAAATLDPAASHGVLRALMSGMAAARAAIGVLDGDLDEAQAIDGYCRWQSDWFEHDAARLGELYRECSSDERLQWPPP